MEVPRHWRLKQQRYALVGEICPHCENKIFPPRPVCPHCGVEARIQVQHRDAAGAVAFPVLQEAQRRA